MWTPPRPARAAGLLARRLAAGRRLPLAWRRVPFLIPINAGCTLIEPAASLYARLPGLDATHATVSSIAMGFPAADIACCGPSVWAYGEQAEAVVQACGRTWSAAARWRIALPGPQEAVQQALDWLAQPGVPPGPVVIADTQDNPGAGGDSNTTGMLHALLQAGAGLRHPGQVGAGPALRPRGRRRRAPGRPRRPARTPPGPPGGHAAGPAQRPAAAGRITVRALFEGSVRLRGPMMQGVESRLGRVACLDVQGVQVVVASGKSQMLDRELYRCVGLQPETMKLLVNKSSVHFRADFAPIASRVLVARARPHAGRSGRLPWTRLPPEVSPRIPDTGL
jgi:microcystin degradation protein MlrC